MIVSAPFIARSLRWVPPALVIIGNCTTYPTLWLALRLLTLPLPRSVFQRLDERIYSYYEAMVGFFYETWSGVEFRFYGDKPPNEQENVLYLSNHQCTVDWIVAEVLCVKQGGYGGRTRYVLKDVLKFVPLYGWCLGERGGIYVKKKGKDHARMINGLNAFVQQKVPLWLVIFPEGTRFNPANTKAIAKSKVFARNLGLPELNNVLTPRTTGFEVALSTIRDHFNAVYDVTIYYEGFGNDCTVRTVPPNMFGFFSGQVRRVHVHIHRIPIDEIPLSAEDQRSWMYQSYQRKDRMIEHIMRNGSFDAPNISHPLPLKYSGPPTLVCMAIIMGSISYRWGHRWWVSALVTSAVLGWIRVLTKTS